jgi:hypothetical protein
LKSTKYRTPRYRGLPVIEIFKRKKEIWHHLPKYDALRSSGVGELGLTQRSIMDLGFPHFLTAISTDIIMPVVSCFQDSDSISGLMSVWKKEKQKTEHELLSVSKTLPFSPEWAASLLDFH